MFCGGEGWCRVHLACLGPLHCSSFFVVTDRKDLVPKEGTMQKLSEMSAMSPLPQVNGGGKRAFFRVQEEVLLPWTSCQVTKQQKEIQSFTYFVSVCKFVPFACTVGKEPWFWDDTLNGVNQVVPFLPFRAGLALCP